MSYERDETTVLVKEPGAREEPSAPPNEKPKRPETFLVLGINGALGRKLTPALSGNEGIKIYGADIVSEGELGSRFTELAEYFDVRSQSDREKIVELGGVQPFDFYYDATWPYARLFNLVRYSGLCRHLISTKPLTPISHYSALQSLVGFDEEMTRERGEYGEYDSEQQPLEGAPSYDDIVRKTVGHDHYPNKPALATVLRNLAKLHSQLGADFS